MPEDISETAFGKQVEELLRRFGWRFLHMNRAKSAHGRWLTNTNKEGIGFPDYLAVRKPRIIFAEIKDRLSKTSPEQDEWLVELEGCQKAVTTPEVYLWRPVDIEEIARILR